VRAPLDRAQLSWDDIDSIKAVTVSRYGLHSSILEISAGERLIILDKKDLAGDPWAVAATIAEFRFTR